MNQQNCFVVMAIGTQSYNGIDATYENLKDIYESVIKPAIITARPFLNVTRADDVSAPGTITTDILTHLMYDDFVIVDLTYPNPNVYYELGIRHSCKTGTILIKNSDINIKAPFDIAHQRFIEYSCTPKGIQELAKQLKEIFKWYDNNPSKPDNQLLHLAQLIKFEFPQYHSKVRPESTMIDLIAENPQILQLAIDPSLSNEEKTNQLLNAYLNNPDIIRKFLMLGLDMQEKNSNSID